LHRYARRSRPKDGVLSHAYVPGIIIISPQTKVVDGRNKSGHDRT